jgi:tetratricopeptide (TPR) repeat protein
MDAIERLWWNGELRAAYLMSRDQLQTPSGDPFRDRAGSLDDAARWHAHGTRAWHLARFDEAGRFLDAAYERRRTALGDRHPQTLATLERLAAVADYTDQRELAEQRFEQVIEGWLALDGKKSLGAAIARRNYASSLRHRGECNEALDLLDQAEKVFKKCVADDDPEYLALRKSRASTLVFAGDGVKAARTAELAIKRTTLPHDHPFVAAAYLALARAVAQLGELGTACKLVRDVIASFQRGYGDHPLTAIAYSLLAEIWVGAGDLEAGADAAQRWYAMYRAFYTLDTFSWGVSALERFLAVGLVDRATEIAEETIAVAPTMAFHCYARLANYQLQHGAHAEGLAWLERAANTAPAARKAEYAGHVERWRRHVAQATVRT